MSQHTPGPWMVGEHGRIVCPSEPRDEGYEVAIVRRSDYARLIAKAPEMLALIKDILMMDDGMPSAIDYDAMRVLLKEIEG